MSLFILIYGKTCSKMSKMSISECELTSLILSTKILLAITLRVTDDTTKLYTFKG